MSIEKNGSIFKSDSGYFDRETTEVLNITVVAIDNDGNLVSFSFYFHILLLSFFTSKVYFDNVCMCIYVRMRFCISFRYVYSWANRCDSFALKALTPHLRNLVDVTYSIMRIPAPCFTLVHDLRWKLCGLRVEKNSPPFCCNGLFILLWPPGRKRNISVHSSYEQHD